jgi:predicted ATP-grasp superfamily ATP-dependent carboligase
MTETPGGHVLIVGVTTRALAISAARAGYRVTAVDPFGDRDLRNAAQVITPRSTPARRFNPGAAATAAENVSAGWVAYTSNLENYPAAVGRLAQGRRLLGNPAPVLALVRNPVALSAFLRSKGFAVPLTRASPPRGPAAEPWLLKPRKSGGGHGVRLWRKGQSLSRSSYLQQQISGIPGSVIFAANGESAVVLGLSRQLVGDSRFGAQAFRYCGSLLGGGPTPVFPRYKELLGTASAMAREVSRSFGLIGLNGIDFVARNGVPYPIEVNPRYSASMELLERGLGLSLFELHVQACQGILPTEPQTDPGIQGKAIVFARRDVIVGQTDAWINRPDVADIPHPGESIATGRPICTVFARASDESTCVRRLVRQARVVYRRVRAHTERAA